MGAMDGGTHQGNGHAPLARVEMKLDALTSDVHDMETKLGERLAGLEAAVNEQNKRNRAEIEALFTLHRQHEAKQDEEMKELSRRVSVLEGSYVKLAAIVAAAGAVVMAAVNVAFRKLWP